MLCILVNKDGVAAPAKGGEGDPVLSFEGCDPSQAMRIFYAFLVIMVSAILFMLPLTDAIYDFRTDLREDLLTTSTGVGETSANVTLFTTIYAGDTSTLSILSDNSSDVPVFSAYDNATHSMNVTGLTANITRILTVSYDVDALSASNAINILLDRIPFIWMLVVISFPMAGLFAIFTGRA